MYILKLYNNCLIYQVVKKSLKNVWLGEMVFGKTKEFQSFRQGIREIPKSNMADKKHKKKQKEKKKDKTKDDIELYKHYETL